MNVLVVGKGPKNSEIISYFEKRGNYVCEKESSDINGLKGCIGSFNVKLAEGLTGTDVVILAEVPKACASDIDGGKVHSIYDEDKMSFLPKKEKLDPVVFLLDYFDDSQIAAHITALNDAKKLACQKRKTYYISRFVRTACPGGEKLYKEARNSGVNFIKFEEINISYDLDEDRFTFDVNDGVISKEISTKTVFTEDSRDTGDVYKNVTRALRITTDENGLINEDRHFLTSALTSRTGVYHINRNVAIVGLEDALDSIANDIAAIEYEAAYGECGEKVIVDGEKCVFCYSCYRACPHAAMEPDLDSRVMENLTASCHSCGICVSVCPGNALELAETDEVFAFEKKKKILVMCCENSAEIAIEKTLPALGNDASLIDVQSISCGGQVGLENISEALTAYEKVMIAVCMDDACKHFDGNKRACAQSDRLKEMLEKSGLDAGRVGYAKVSPVMPGVLKDEIKAFMKGELA